MSDTVEVEAQADIYDAGEGVYRRAGDTFDIAESAVGKHGGLLVPTDELGESDVADADSTAESGGSDGEDAPADDSSDDLTDLSGVGEATADKLADEGYDSPTELADADAATVADDVDGLSESDVADLQRQLQ